MTIPTKLTISSAETYMLQQLTNRQAAHTFRQLTDKAHLIDFASNDYLGLARKPEMYTKTLAYAEQWKGNSSTGSRLISGNSKLIEALEEEIASFHQAATGLIFNSGYDANVGIFSCLPQRGDTIISDELIHASIIDGIRLSKANRLIFKHNDLDSLDDCLKKAKGVIYIAIESLYSMDGDFAPMSQIVALATKYGANIIVDEAHATGVIGNKGAGLVQKLGLEKEVFARIHTFGKALAAHGAIILGSKTLKSYLINHARSFIYTTALPPHSFAAIKASYEIFPQMNQEREQLYALQHYFHQYLNNNNNSYHSNSQIHSPIQSILIKEGVQAKKIAKKIERDNFYAKAIVYPTVATGQERIRICLHAFNQKKEIKSLFENIYSK